MHRLDQERVGVGFALGNFRGFSNVHRALCTSYFIRKAREKLIVFVTIEAFRTSPLKTKHLWAFMKPQQGVECGSWAKHCPLPLPAARLLFLRTYLKT
jgi:hypothetical protein